MKKVYKSIVFTCILLITVCSKCEWVMDYSYEIDLVNNAEHPIGYYFATGGKYGTYYPDSLPETNAYVVYDASEELRSGMRSGLAWEKLFQSFPKDTLSVFIFHTDTLNKYTWEEVRDGYMILKRYDLSLYDLEKIHFKITYP